MLGSSLGMLQFTLAWMGLSVARNEVACPIPYHIPCSSWYHHHTVQFFRLQKLNRKIETTYYRRPRWSSDWILRFWTPADPFRWTKTSVKYSYKYDMTTMYIGLERTRGTLLFYRESSHVKSNNEKKWISPVNNAVLPSIQLRQWYTMPR